MRKIILMCSPQNVNVITDEMRSIYRFSILSQMTVEIFEPVSGLSLSSGGFFARTEKSRIVRKVQNCGKLVYLKCINF